MALSLSELNAVTNDWWDKRKPPQDIYFSSNVLLWMLMKGGAFKKNIVTADELVDGGARIRVFLEYAKGNSGAYGNSVSIASGKVNIINAARFRWAGEYASNTIDLNDRVANAGDSAMVKLAMQYLNNIIKTVRDSMGTHLYASAADNNSILGLGNLFNTTTSTAYATIAEDDMAKWKANAITAAYEAVFKTFQLIRRTASVGQTIEDKPNLYITTETNRDGFERTLQVQARYADTELVNAGFRNVLFDGSPVVADDKQTANYVDALNTRLMAIKTHSDFAFTKPAWEVTNPSQPDIWTANQRWIGQLVTSHRAAHCRATNVTEPA